MPPSALPGVLGDDLAEVVRVLADVAAGSWYALASAATVLSLETSWLLLPSHAGVQPPESRTKESMKSFSPVAAMIPAISRQRRDGSSIAPTAKGC
jgi:hypothetical protein